MVHNHPSKADLAITRRVSEALDTLGVTLLDHIIVGQTDQWFSLRDQDYM